MKKFYLFVILTVVWLGSFAQSSGQPCAPLDQNRTIEDMREILMRDGLFYENLRRCYAEAINFSVGKKVVNSSKDGINEILNNTVFVDADFIVPSDYYNGVRYGSTVKFTNLTGQPSKKWAAYQNDGQDHIYAKVSCMNPEKIKCPVKKEAQNVPPRNRSEQPQGLPIDYGGRKLQAEAAASTPIAPTGYVYQKEKTHKKFFKKTGVVIGCVVIGASGVGGIIYAILHKGAAVPPHGTMSGGRPFDETTTTTGGPSTNTPSDNGGRGD